MTNNLKKLIRRQETKVRQLKTDYQEKLRRRKRQNQVDIAVLKKQYEQKIKIIAKELENQTEELKHEIAFHKEMNDAQRTMLEDAISQCQKLEERPFIELCQIIIRRV